MIRLSLVLLYVGAWLGCTAAQPADFTPFVGDWKCNKELTLKEQLAAAPKERGDFAEKFAQSVALRSTEENEPPHANIRVTQRRIVGTDAVLEPQYDILSAEWKDGVLIAHVRYHEERHDQGDFLELTIHARKLGERFALEMHVPEMPIPIVYVFERK